MARNRTTLFTPVDCRHGAPMGRGTITEIHGDRTSRPMLFRLERIRWTDDAYDQGGAYWGMGAPVYLAEFTEGETHILRSYRARNRQHATEQLQAEFPTARVRHIHNA